MYLIDAYNLLYKRADMPTEEALIHAIERFCDYNNKRAELVFDGEWQYDGEYDTQLLSVIYTYDADEYIRQAVQEMPGSVVVSSDREIRKFAHSHKSRTIKSEDFDFHIPGNLDDTVGEDINPFVSDAQVEAFLDLFTDETE